MQKKTILVTGGAGFIGSHFIDNALAGTTWDKVVCVDNLVVDTGTKDKKANIKHNLNNPKLVFYKTDIKNAKAIEDIFAKEKPSVVVHFAAIADTRDAVDNPQKYIDTNITGTTNLLMSSRKHEVKKFVFISSSSVYGNKNKAPFTESMQTDFSISPYGATKKAGEVLAHTFAHYGLPVVVLRIFNAYGERIRPNLVMYKWIKAILDDETIEMSGKGTRKRDFTYVGDIVDAVNKSINKNISYEVLNIGNAQPVALKDLLKIIEKVIGKKAKVMNRPSHKASVEKTHADVKKAKKVIHWQPKTSFEEGIRRLVEWYKNNRLK